VIGVGNSQKPGVVLASAMTHNRRRQLLQKASAILTKSMSRGVRVPAFTGTTTEW
jgi:hypothetical protein